MEAGLVPALGQMSADMWSVAGLGEAVGWFVMFEVRTAPVFGVVGSVIAGVCAAFFAWTVTGRFLAARQRADRTRD